MAAPLSPKLDWPLANPLWAQILNGVISCPVIQGNALTDISLVANTPKTLNHGLGRLQQGVFITPFGNAVVWVSQPFNSSTITLTSSANVLVNLWNY